MKKIFSFALPALLALPLLTACPSEPPPPPDGDTDGVPDAEDKCPTEAGDKANSGCKPPPPKPTIPDYAPTGDDAELKKQGAAGIDGDNAAAKAGDLEKAIDESIVKLEAAKAAPAPAAK